MKRVLVAVCAALVLVFDQFAGVLAQDSTPASTTPVLAVYVTATGEEAAGTPEQGDRCYFGWSSPDYWWLHMPYQIIVRDEYDTIISVTDVDPEYVKNEDNGDLYCVFDSQIPLPPASFYGVSINDTYLTTFTPDTLPTDPDQGLYIDLGPSPID